MLEFNEEKHEYTLNGKTLISVTQLMRKHNLAPSYDNVSQEVLQAKAERGTLIHKEIEEYNTEKKIGFTEELGNYIQYIQEHKVDVINSEYKVNNDIVAGTIDLICIEDNKNIVADLKTTYQLHKEAVSWQLSIYAYLYWMSWESKELAKKDYETMIGKAYHFEKDSKLNVVEIKLKPFEEIEKLMECERKGEIYKQELVIQDNKLMELADLETYITSLEEKVKQAKEQQANLKNALMDEMEKQNLKSFENDRLKLTYVAPSQRNSTKVDTKTLKEKYPNVYDELVTTSTTEVSRSLRITVKEKKDES